MVPRPSSPKVGVSLLSSPVGFAMRSDDEKTIHELRDMLGNSMAIRERIEGEKLVRRMEKEGEEEGRVSWYRESTIYCLLFTFWQTLLDRIEHLEKLCDKKEKFLQVSTSRQEDRLILEYYPHIPLFSSSHSSLPPSLPPSFSQPR